jgi:drug/metabolite transporter (DMT)-like permease
MKRAHQILAVVFGVVGVALVVRGVIGGIWPVSIQLLAGILLVALAVLRWRYA